MRIAWGSCDQPSGGSYWANRVIDANPSLFVMQGDLIYPVQRISYTGLVADTLTETSTKNNYLTHYNGVLAKPAIQQLLNANFPVYYQFDDHEFIGNDWDHTIGASNNSFVPTPNHTTLAEVAASWWEGRQALTDVISTNFDNKVNTDGVSPELPPEIATLGGSAPPTSQYPVGYFRQRFNRSGQESSTGTHVEVFSIDTLSYRAPAKSSWIPTPASTAGTTMLGTNQKNWLKTQLSASTCTWKVILSPKMTYKNGGFNASNPDTWHEYAAERDEIINHIKTNNIDNVVWLAGDRHTPTIIDDGAGHICLVGCPLGVTLNNQNLDNYTISNNNIWWGYDQVFGQIDFLDDKAVFEFKSINKRGSIVKGEILLDSNTVTFPRNKVGF